jgi:uncharacterized membrane protein YbaN (DUF454 family)
MVSTAAPPTAAPRIPEDFADAAPAREPSVVHSSYGRLRVHLPHWPGTRGEEIVAALRHLPGVTDAEASPLTGNVLLRFEPAQTSAPALLEALPALRLRPQPQPAERDQQLSEEEGPLRAAVNDDLEPRRDGTAVYMTGARRVLYKALGWTSVGMAVVGAIVPGIPTAPFVVLAGYFFVRSSPEAHQWLRRSRWFGTFLRDWEAYRGVRRSVRNAAAGLIGVGMAVTPLLGLPVPLVATILPLQLVGLAIVLRLRVIDPSLPAPAAV